MLIDGVFHSLARLMSHSSGKLRSAMAKRPLGLDDVFTLVILLVLFIVVLVMLGIGWVL